MVKGYFNSDEANRESYDSDSFYHTGDIALCDGKTEKWYIVDRKKVVSHEIIFELGSY